jgi:hypothetical protein
MLRCRWSSLKLGQSGLALPSLPLNLWKHSTERTYVTDSAKVMFRFDLTRDFLSPLLIFLFPS